MAVSGDVESANRPEAEASRTPEDLAKARRIEVSTVLSDRRLRFWPRCASPELRKVMASLPEALDEICRLLGRRAEICPHEPLDDVTVARLEALLSTRPSGLDLDSAWQLLEGLQSMFLTLGAHDVAYVRSVLDVERGLEKRSDDDWEEPWPYYGWGRVRWRQVFPTVPVDEIPDAGSARAAATKTDDASEPAVTSPQGSPEMDDTVQMDALGLAVERLHKLFRMRVENGRSAGHGWRCGTASSCTRCSCLPLWSSRWRPSLDRSAMASRGRPSP